MAASLDRFRVQHFSDLSEERQGVLGATQRLKLQHDSMEFFGARADQPIETCLQEVRASDILVVIVGHRYGSVVPDLGTSYSEAEYSEGYRLKKPCLVYMRDDNVPILPRQMEREPEKLWLLEKWKEVLNARHTVASFQDGGRLAVQVTADLARTIQGLEEVTKVRAEARSEAGTTIMSDVASVITEALSQGVSEASLLSAVRSSVSSLLATLQKREPTAFLSYARGDSGVVRPVGEGLAAPGVRVRLDEDVEIKPGERWSEYLEQIEQVQSTSDYVVFFLSPNSVKSQFVMLRLATRSGKSFTAGRSVND